MASLKKRSRILVVASSQETYAVIRRVIEGACEQVLHAGSVTEARQMLAQGNIGLVIINTPLPDEFGLESAKDFSQGMNIGVLLLVKGELFSQISYKVRGSGVFVLARPLKGQMLLEAVGVMDTMRLRLYELSEENQKLRRRLDEMSLVTRAKCLLIERRRMSEEEAHHFLEQEAMNNSLTKKEVARNLIEEMENE